MPLPALVVSWVRESGGGAAASASCAQLHQDLPCLPISFPNLDCGVERKKKHGFLALHLGISYNNLLLPINRSRGRFRDIGDR